MSAGDEARLIGRLPADRRRRILEAAVRAAKGRPVLVEHAYDRKLDAARTMVARLEVLAYTTGGGSADVLVVYPTAAGYRAHALPAAHVLRVRFVDVYPAGGAGTVVDDLGTSYVAGEVLVGPPA